MNMFCTNCGATIPEQSKYCAKCGQAVTVAAGVSPQPAKPVNEVPVESGIVGYSSKISDPAFARYIKRSNTWARVFSVILALAAVIGSYIAGESGSGEMSNPKSVLVGLAVGAMFLLIGIISVSRKKHARTWDGAVADKTMKKKTKRQSYGDDSYTYRKYIEYAVVIREDGGKTHRLVSENDAVYNYYQIGDKVRFHGGLNTYEKYDKSRDTAIYCNACGKLCDIHKDTCPRCKCPLLK
jgi:hypothetical protein